MSLQDLEVRRRTAVKLLESGLSQQEVAETVGSSQSSVSRWWKQYREHGDAGLLPVPGHKVGPRKFTDEHLAMLAQLVLSPPGEGYLWTCRRLAEAMKEKTGIQVHPNTIQRLLHERGFSHQKPTRRAYKQKPGAEEAFRTSTWPSVKKNSSAKSARSLSSTKHR